MNNFKKVELELSSRFDNDAFIGFWPPLGWLELVEEIHEHLLPNPNYRIWQVKEKFGGLRFYAYGLTEKERVFVHAKEKESTSICQQCGSRENVNLYNKGPRMTLCASCEKAVPSILAIHTR